MTADITRLDAHEQPSDYLRGRWKTYARATPQEILASGDIDEIRDAADPSPFCIAGTIPAARVARTFETFLADGSDGSTEADVQPSSLAPETDVSIFFHPLLPGLLIVPSLVPLPVQKRLLDRLVHRDLSCQRHQTNMHLHYHLPYPENGASFFSYPKGHRTGSDSHSSVSVAASAAVAFTPKDPSVHRPLSVDQVLSRRLHWATLGGQYDWTNRVYPDGETGDGDANQSRVPAFPPDLAQLLAGLFPDTVAQAAIVNFYTPGDTMMMHRDVSEETDKGLISISMGCEALFMAAPTREFGEGQAAAAAEAEAAEAEAAAATPAATTPAAATPESATPESTRPPNTRKKPYVLLRLRSGDALYMTGRDRFAWHGVPKVIKGSCPEELAAWPAGEHPDGRYEAWRGWMADKRVNLNVRQMRD